MATTFQVYLYSLNPASPDQASLLSYRDLPVSKGAAPVLARLVVGEEVASAPFGLTEKAEPKYVLVGLPQRDVDEEDAIIGRFWLGKLARLARPKLGQRTTRDIVAAPASDWRSADLILDTKRQVVLVAHANRISQSARAIARILSRGLGRAVHSVFDHHVDVHPMTRESGRFWERMEEAEKLYSLRIEAVTPNVWWLAEEAQASLAAARAEYNAVKVGLQLENGDGNLRVSPEDVQLADLVDYVECGGGRYEAVIGRRDGAKQRIQSDETADVLTVAESFVSGSTGDPDQPMLPLEASSPDSSFLERLAERIERKWPAPNKKSGES